MENKPINAESRQFPARMSEAEPLSFYGAAVIVLLSAEAYERERADRLQVELDATSLVIRNSIAQLGHIA